MLWTFAGAVSAFLSVALGAFGAHALRGRISGELLSIFETAVRWQLAHALALVALGLGAGRLAARDVNVVGWLFLAGTVVFAGSLYALVASGVRGWGAVTPVGGLAFLFGWAWLAWAALSSRNAEPKG